MGLWLAVGMCGGLLALCGCGGGSGDDSDGSSGSGGLLTAESAADTSAPGPPVHVPGGTPPTTLVTKDFKVGYGPEAKVGNDVTILYVGAHWNGERFSNAWTYNKKPHFELGTRELLPSGLDKGVVGMRVGGRREVIVPVDLLYYPDETHPPLHPSDTLVFVVDLLGVRQGEKQLRKNGVVSNSKLIAKADAICLAGGINGDTKRLVESKVGQKAFSSGGFPKLVVERVWTPDIEGEIATLKVLSVSAGSASAGLDAVIVAMERALTESQADPNEAILGASPFRRAENIGKRHGFEICGAPE